MADAHAHTHEEQQEKLEPKVEVQEVGPCKLKIRIEIDASKVKDRIDHKYKDLNDKMAFPGFRPGKTPRNIIERKYGKSILEDVKFELLTHSFEEVKESRHLDILSEPEMDAEKIELKEGAAFAYEFTVEVKPTFELKTWQGVKIKKVVPEATDKELDARIEELREHKAELVPAEDGAREKDTVVADFELVVDGATADKAENKQVVLLPDITFYGQELPDFFQKLAGKKSGDSAEYSITLDAGFHDKKLAGKAAVIRTKLKSVKRRVLPAVNVEFAKTFDLDSVDELRADVKKQLLKTKEREAKEAMGDAAVAELIKQNDFKLPEGYVKQQGEDLEKRLRVDYMSRGMRDEKQLAETIAKELAGSKERIEHAIKEELILDYIAKKEKLFVTEDEVEERLHKYASEMGQPLDQLRAYFEEQGMMTAIRRTMRREKVRDVLLEKAALE